MSKLLEIRATLIDAIDLLDYAESALHEEGIVDIEEWLKGLTDEVGAVLDSVNEEILEAGYELES